MSTPASVLASILCHYSDPASALSLFFLPLIGLYLYSCLCLDSGPASALYLF